MRRIVFHPFLFAVAPVLFVFVNNARRFALSLSELVLPVVLALVSAGVLFGVLTLLLQSWAKAGIVTSWVAVLFVMYRPAFAALNLARFGRSAFLLLLLLLVLIVLWLVIRARGRLAGLTVFLNACALVVVGVNLVSGLSGRVLSNTFARAKKQATRMVKPQTEVPDIYYIILDSYVRSDYLKADYGVDNSGFLDFLRQNGFFVARRARSNYAQTHLSLASSLNVTYLDGIAAEQGERSQNVAPLNRMIEDSKVVEFLKSRGYRIVTYASGYTGTELKNADVRRAPLLYISEFRDVLLEATILPQLLGSSIGRLRDELHRQNIQFILRTIADAGRSRSQPSFVFAHVLCPHTPFVFDSLGNRPKIVPYQRVNQTGTSEIVTRQQLQQWHKANYGPQVVYLNRLVREAVTKILRDAPRPVVVIIQGDHGAGVTMTEDERDPTQLVRRHAILNAIRLPDDGGRVLYDEISPVNTFRVILDRYFDTTLALLPDRSYFSLLSRPYQLRLVTAPDPVPE